MRNNTWRIRNIDSNNTIQVGLMSSDIRSRPRIPWSLSEMVLRHDPPVGRNTIHRPQCIWRICGLVLRQPAYQCIQMQHPGLFQLLRRNRGVCRHPTVMGQLVDACTRRALTVPWMRISLSHCRVLFSVVQNLTFVISLLCRAVFSIAALNILWCH